MDLEEKRNKIIDELQKKIEGKEYNIKNLKKLIELIKETENEFLFTILEVYSGGISYG